MPTQKLNYPLVLAELLDAGLTQTEIALRCGCRQSHISDLANGGQAEARASIAFALLGLHAEFVGGRHRPQVRIPERLLVMDRQPRRGPARAARSVAPAAF